MSQGLHTEADIFRRGSTTYYWSSRFFPKPIRQDVFRLYSFVRVADNYVDEIPPQPNKLLALEKAWLAASRDNEFDTTTAGTEGIDERIIKNLVYLSRKYHFRSEWIAAFFQAMKTDIHPRSMKTLDESLSYVYGSAEVIGLMMAAIMRLSDEASEAAAKQGRAMQWINFIRDVAEDAELKRLYIPLSDLKAEGLPELTSEEARKNPAAFRRLMNLQLDRYHGWQAEAATGFKFIPRRYRVPLRTAVDMYDWTARRIAADPMIVWNRKIKPAKTKVLRTAAKRSLHA